MSDALSWRLGGLEVAFGGDGREEAIGGFVEVEDTYRIMSADPALPWPPPRGDAFEIMTRASLFEPHPHGEVLVETREGAGRAIPRLVAILYDFDRTPPTDRTIVGRAISRVFDRAEAAGVGVLALPYDFGLSHGGVPEDEWLEILVRTCKERASGLRNLRKIVVTFPLDGRIRAGRAAVLFGILVAREEAETGAAGLPGGAREREDDLSEGQ